VLTSSSSALHGCAQLYVWIVLLHVASCNYHYGFLLRAITRDLPGKRKKIKKIASPSGDVTFPEQETRTTKSIS
jgi:hypothetical protein